MNDDPRLETSPPKIIEFIMWVSTFLLRKYGAGYTISREFQNQCFHTCTLWCHLCSVFISNLWNLFSRIMSAHGMLLFVADYIQALRRQKIRVFQKWFLTFKFIFIIVSYVKWGEVHIWAYRTHSCIAHTEDQVRFLVLWWWLKALCDSSPRRSNAHFGHPRHHAYTWYTHIYKGKLLMHVK